MIVCEGYSAGAHSVHLFFHFPHSELVVGFVHFLYQILDVVVRVGLFSEGVPQNLYRCDRAVSFERISEEDLVGYGVKFLDGDLVAGALGDNLAAIKFGVGLEPFHGPSCCIYCLKFNQSPPAGLPYKPPELDKLLRFDVIFFLLVSDGFDFELQVVVGAVVVVLVKSMVIFLGVEMYECSFVVFVGLAFVEGDFL